MRRATGGITMLRDLTALRTLRWSGAEIIAAIGAELLPLSPQSAKEQRDPEQRKQRGANRQPPEGQDQYINVKPRVVLIRKCSVRKVHPRHPFWGRRSWFVINVGRIPW